MVTMRSYKVKINDSASDDLKDLFLFLTTVLSPSSVDQYIEMLSNEVASLSIIAGIYPISRQKNILKIHTQARRMVSKNRKWNYIYHIENDNVFVDRIIASKYLGIV